MPQRLSSAMRARATTYGYALAVLIVAGCKSTPTAASCGDPSAAVDTCPKPASIPIGFRAYRGQYWAFAAPSVLVPENQIPASVPSKQGETTLEMAANDEHSGLAVVLVVHHPFDGDFAALLSRHVAHARSIAGGGGVDVDRIQINGRACGLIRYDFHKRRQWSLVTFSDDRSFELACTSWRATAGDDRAKALCMQVFETFVVR